MCTVTAVWQPQIGREWSDDLPVLRVLCNRDEQRSRPRSLPPRASILGDRRAVMPIDPTSGGTWIGVNDAGLVACLLNARPQVLVNGKEPSESRPESRGGIVPRLLRTCSVSDAAVIGSRIDPACYPPFRVLLADHESHVVIESDGDSVTCNSRSFSGEPLLLASSGLGDHLVEPARRDLFHRLLDDHANPHDAQRCCHSHAWPGRGHVSVLMSRPDARTVSQTAIDLFSTRVVLRHTLVGEDLLPEPLVTVCELAVGRRSGVAA